MFLSEEVDFLKAELFARNLVAGELKMLMRQGYVLPSRLGVYRVMLRSIWLPRKRMRLVPARNMTINKAHHYYYIQLDLDKQPHPNEASSNDACHSKLPAPNLEVRGKE